MVFTWKERLLALAAVLAIALLVAACGGDDDSTKTNTPAATQTQSSNGSSTTAANQPTTTTTTNAPATNAPAGGGAVDACAMLTTAEVSAATTETMVDGVPTNDAPNYECEWDNADQTTVVYLTVYTNGRDNAAESEYDILDSGSEAVDGLGDKAHWVTIIETLEVLQGQYNVEIQVVDFKTGADAETEAKELAPKVLDRLP